MLKVDSRKVFDSVRWDFILGALRAIHIPLQFVNWISECITSATFTISINGTSDGFFKNTKGIRQGDPLSPYLFVLAMEVFSQLLLTRYASGYIRYHPKTSDINISHLIFADDVMIFFDGSSSSLHGIAECLYDFWSWSGLRMNMTKTELFTTGLSLAESTIISQYGFPMGSLPIRYLGLPLMSRRLKISEYAPLLGNLTSKFQTGLGGISRIESICSRFLWSGQIVDYKRAKVSWSTVCLPKAEGGLGLRLVVDWNRALCLCFTWRLFYGADSLWVAWQKLYRIGSKKIWSLKASSKDSWNWIAIMNIRPLALRFLQAKIGNGRTASFWYDV